MAAPGLIQRLVQGRAAFGQLVHRDHPGDLLPIQIIAGQEFLPQFFHIAGVVEQKFPLVGEPALPVPQDGGAKGLAGAGKGDHVHLGVLIHHHLLAGGPPC